MSCNPFQSAERDRFFRSIGLTWYNLCPIHEATGIPQTNQQKPYALYHCQPVSRQTIQTIKQASEQVGQVLMQVWSIVRDLSPETLLDYGFPPETIRLVKHDALPPFCMRLDWCWNEATGDQKLIEVNAQTPSFWFECGTGNRQVAQHFGWSDPDPTSEMVLTRSLNQHIQRAASSLGKSVAECQIGFTALNNPEDMGTMKWLQQHCLQSSVVFPLEYLRIQDGDGLFNVHTNKPIDILFMWYPIEWAIHDTDAQGQTLWSALEQLILQRKVAVVNFGSAFSLQPKSILSLITDLGYDFFDSPEAAAVMDYFPQTALTPQAIGSTYFAKPILGRQGEGAFAVAADTITDRSSDNHPWYTQQAYVYQELLDLPKIKVAARPMTALWGVWLYNDGSDRLTASGVGVRVSEGLITDDRSYWCPIGC